MSIATEYPARTDGNGRTWYRPVREDGMSIAQWGWTADPDQAHPDYTAALPEETPVPRPSPDPATARPKQRTTQFMHYPLPPLPPRYRPRFKNRRYLLPDPETGRAKDFARATTVAGTLDDTSNLEKWKVREAVRNILGLVEHAIERARQNSDDSTPAVAASSALLYRLIDAFENSSTVGGIDAVITDIDNAMGGADARELGTAVHEWLEALDIGTVLMRDVPEIFRPFVDAYYSVLRRYGLVPVPAYVERLVMNNLGIETVVGTLDRIYRIVATGDLILGDVKTSKTTSLPYGWLGYGVQLAIYGWAPLMLSMDGTRWEPMPKLRGIPHPDDTTPDDAPAFAILVSVPSDDPTAAQAITMCLSAGGEAMVTSLEARKRRQDAKNTIPFQHAIPSPTDASIRYAEARIALSNITTPADLNQVWELYQDVWDDDLTEHGQRLSALF